MKKQEKIKNGAKRLQKEEVLLYLARMGEITFETLLELMLGAGEMIIAMMSGTSKRESLYYISKAAERERNIHIDLQSKVSLYTMLSRLTKEGLVERKREKIKITKKGNEKICSSKLIELKNLPEGKNILVIFDIPEKLSKKREWLRNELKIIGFEMIQKSVWKGSVAIPKKFLKDIFDLGLKNYVHIFEVTQYGTLKH